MVSKPDMLVSVSNGESDFCHPLSWMKDNRIGEILVKTNFQTTICLVNWLYDEMMLIVLFRIHYKDPI